MRQVVKAECSACGGTGVYKGFAEPSGVGVVCLECKGTGCREIAYTPFTERKRRDGIRIVRLSRGSLIATGVGPAGSEVTYEQFLRGEKPTP
jgi:hypothetical protein